MSTDHYLLRHPGSRPISSVRFSMMRSCTTLHHLSSAIACRKLTLQGTEVSCRCSAPFSWGLSAIQFRRSIAGDLDPPPHPAAGRAVQPPGEGHKPARNDLDHGMRSRKRIARNSFAITLICPMTESATPVKLASLQRIAAKHTRQEHSTCLI